MCKVCFKRFCTFPILHTNSDGIVTNIEYREKSRQVPGNLRLIHSLLAFSMEIARFSLFIRNCSWNFYQSLGFCFQIFSSLDYFFGNSEINIPLININFFFAGNSSISPECSLKPWGFFFNRCENVACLHLKHTN